LKAYGLKRHDQAVIGGNVFSRDLEETFGNTGFQLLAVILEKRTGKSLDKLIKSLVTGPLDIEDMFLYLRPDPHGRIADGYDLYTDDPIDVYPLVDFNGHTALNVFVNLALGLPANINFAGGSGGLVATPRSYAAFLHAFVGGRLLGPGPSAS
jgi:CubicO group peptidase (beta-lactamase class C family)